ncbi:MAG: formimidoylglutamate deiminase [Burkholderiales bacterium]|nr:formimidoylglutamate deiminase [Burkholderiales bacterium]
MSQTLFAQHALLPQGWASNVRLAWNDAGDLTRVEPNSTPLAGEHQQTWVLPGMINLHSHAFQRAMAGMTEFAGENRDSFWTWRDLMYRFARQITPEHIEAIAAQLYSECLRYGYTSVCEFHYVQRVPNGAWYGAQAEMAQRVIAGAAHSGIGITMLPVLYSYANFGEQPLRDEQCRFKTDVDDVMAIVAALEPLRSSQVEVGAAPHSLRAASIAQIRDLQQRLPAARPLHIHIAEQQKEVQDCVAHSGLRPVQLLAKEIQLDQRWCLVHATHLLADEVSSIASSGAIAGLCPTTEANLGDGLFAFSDFIAQGGVFGIGSDSHVSQSPVEELRWLEYGQRLQQQARNIATTPQERSVGDFLWQASLQGGAQASGRQVGSLAVGKRADLLVLDDSHPNLAAVWQQDVLNTLIFCGNDNLIRDVMVGGQWRVENGRHQQQAEIAARYRATMQELQQLRAEKG